MLNSGSLSDSDSGLGEKYVDEDDGCDSRESDSEGLGCSRLGSFANVAVLSHAGDVGSIS